MRWMVVVLALAFVPAQAEARQRVQERTWIDAAAAPAYPIASPGRQFHVKRARARHRRYAAPVPRRPARPARVARPSPVGRAAIAGALARTSAPAVAAIHPPLIPTPPVRPSNAAPAPDAPSTPAAPVQVAAPPPRQPRPRRIDGTIVVAGQRFSFASGGRGWSIPIGSWRVTPGAVGPWGRRHGAIGLHGGTIWDPQLKRNREGIEFHAARGGTRGCVGIPKAQWKAFKAAVLGLVRKTGDVWLHVTTGGARVTVGRSA